jgi:uncharacterized MAPEG superfamily protein
MGSLDRIIRLVLAAAFAALILTKTVAGTPAIVLGALGGIFVLTSIVGFCPLYVLLGISTKKKAPKA